MLSGTKSSLYSVGENVPLVTFSMEPSHIAILCSYVCYALQHIQVVSLRA